MCLTIPSPSPSPLTPSPSPLRQDSCLPSCQQPPCRRYSLPYPPSWIVSLSAGPMAPPDCLLPMNWATSSMQSSPISRMRLTRLSPLMASQIYICLQPSSETTPSLPPLTSWSPAGSPGTLVLTRAMVLDAIDSLTLLLAQCIGVPRCMLSLHAPFSHHCRMYDDVMLTLLTAWIFLHSFLMLPHMLCSTMPLPTPPRDMTTLT